MQFENLISGLFALKGRKNLELIDEATHIIGQFLEIDLVILHYATKTACFPANHAFAKEINSVEWLSDGPYVFNQRADSPIIIDDCERSRKFPKLVKQLRVKGCKSYLAYPLRRNEQVVGVLQLLKFRELRRFSDELHILRAVAECVNSLLGEAQVLKDSATLDDAKSFSFERLIATSNSIIIRTDREFRIEQVIGDCHGFLGCSTEHLINSGSEIWKEILSDQDAIRLQRILTRANSLSSEFSEEFRIRNVSTGELRWLIIRAVPRFTANKKLSGWEGIGIDISEQRRTKDALAAQRRRVEALYEVSRALQMNLDPSMVTLHGLRALIRATESDSGLGFSYDEQSKQLELVAAEGVTSAYIEEVELKINDRSLVRYSVENGEGLIIPDIQSDSRAAVRVAEREGLKSTIVMPIMLEGRCLGAMVLFCKTADAYKKDDLDLVKAAANQIALATYQAELFATQRKQASSFAALYRLSHELTSRFSLSEIAERSFAILHEELACKRIWLGVINEQGTHLVGQGGFGPGIRKKICDLQVELSLRHDFLDQAISMKQPIVVKPGDNFECSGLNTILSKLAAGPFAIVPLVSLSHVVGVLIVEPAIASGFFTLSKLNFLASLGSEIATAILARRFEGRMAEAEKMRMAGLLASGVAHNFNNLLQAVMGQASLLEIQLAPGSSGFKSTQMIKSAAQRGANLVRQLLTLAKDEPDKRAPFSVHSFLSDSIELYRSILGNGVQLTLNAPTTLLDIDADYSQVQQVMTNILVNARDALGASGEVQIDATIVRVRSGEIDPELAPGQYVRISVNDTGAGMDSERLSRCFEPFYTTKNVDPVTGIGVGGSGLGLSTAYLIVKRHGGLITAHSQLGVGSTFTIFLPVHQQTSQNATNRSGIATSQSNGQSMADKQKEAAYTNINSKRVPGGG